MRLHQLLFRSLAYYWRIHLAVIAGVGIAVAVLSGALLVGQSVRDSLRALVIQRLGTTDTLVSSDRFFSEELAARIASGEPAALAGCPIIFLQGVLSNEVSGVRAHDVNVYGIDERFWKFQNLAAEPAPEERSALVGVSLAQRLGVRPGDTLLLRTETPQGVPRESFYGRRESVGRTLRLVCRELLPVEKLGEFALRPSQGSVYSVFVPLQRLQRDLAQPGRANSILLRYESSAAGRPDLRQALKEHFTLQDIGVQMRRLPSGAGLSVETSRILLDDAVSRAAFDAAAEMGLKASGLFTYLANTIRARGREVPYSVITAADLGEGALAPVAPMAGSPAPSASGATRESIWINAWAGQDLGVSPGDSVEIDYYHWQEEGLLTTRTAAFRLAGLLPMGGVVDSSLAPDIPGISRTTSIRDWDPPFPLDLRRIRPQDEDYWKRYQAAPKAFVSLARGQELWQNRHGKLTAVRIALPEGADANSPADRLERSIRGRIDPESAGFTINPVRQNGLEASQSSTDFGAYFFYFSFFLIAAALLLSAMFFKLGIEQRAAEIGTLQALGFPMRLVRRLCLLEGFLLSLAGSLLGLLGSMAYGWLMLFGLRTWWAGAVGTSRLFLHVSWMDMGLGAICGMLAASASIAWTLVDLRRHSPRALLAGVLETRAVRGRNARNLGIISLLALLTALLLLLLSSLGKLPEVGAFFGAGLLLLLAMLSLIAIYLRRAHPAPIDGYGWPALVRLGFRNAAHRPGRSLLCVALIASATFIIVSVEAFRQDPRSISLQPQSGTGGYPLVADSALPLLLDPNSPEGRESLGIAASEVPELSAVRFVPFRVRPGDDTSCLNLYAPREPKILGASHAFVAAGRFLFQGAAATTPEQEKNPWLLLEIPHPDGAIPTIGDANTLQYILHLGIGGELTVRGGNGKPVRLRLVAALRDSLLQGGLLISEAAFLQAFPDREGYRFFLLESPSDQAEALVRPMMERLADLGFNVETSRARLAAYHRVENTYLSTFQALGALGLVLGTIGLATVLLRNVLERRKELALLRAVGYRRLVLSGMVVAENAFLMLFGLACGTLCAFLAIAPALHSRGVSLPAAMVGLILFGVLAAGLTSSILAVIAAFRTPLLESLRSE